MPLFSDKSLDHLRSCDVRLQTLFLRVIKDFNCTVIIGHRTRKEQDHAYKNKNSKLQWPNSKHNKYPSLAVDVAPFPIDWRDLKRFYFFGGYVLGLAKEMGIPLRWGGDWDSDKDVNDQTFFDLVHFELK